jgi:hypothetical protein
MTRRKDDESDGCDDDMKEGGRAKMRDDEEGKTEEGRTAGGGSSSALMRIEPSSFRSDVPLEFVREVARAGAVAEAGHVEGGAAARHRDWQLVMVRRQLEKFQVSSACSSRLTRPCGIGQCDRWWCLAGKDSQESHHSMIIGCWLRGGLMK